MKRPIHKNRGIALACGALLSMSYLVAQTPAAQTTPPATPKTGNIGLYRNQLLAPDGPAPKFADGTPDLSGAWLGSGGSDADISNPK
jgi:hypothetical protein